MTAPKRRATAPLPLVLAALAIVAASRPADAGAVYGGGVGITDGSDPSYGYVSGSLGATRRSASYIEFIGCSVDAAPGYRAGYCEASNAAMKYRTCWTDDPEIVDAIASIGPASEVRFWWHDWGICSAVNVTNTSYLL